MATEFESILDRLKSKIDGKSFIKTGPNTFKRLTYPESGIKKIEYVSKGNPNIKGKEKGRVTEKFKPYISRKTKGKQKSRSIKPLDTLEEARTELKKLQKKYPRQDLVRPSGLASAREKPALDRMAELLFLADAEDDIRPLASLSQKDAANIGYFTRRQDNMEYLAKKSGLSVEEIFDIFDDREAYIALEKNPDSRIRAAQTQYGERRNFYRKAEKWLLNNGKRYSDPEKFKKAFNRTFGKNNIFNKLLNSDKTQLNLQFSDSFKKEFLGAHEFRDSFGRVKGIKPDSDIIRYSIHKKSANDIFKTVLYNLNPSVRNKLLNEFRKAIPKTKPKAKDLYEIRQFIRNNKLFKQYGVDRAIRGPIARLLYKDLGEETLKEISELRKKKLGTASLLRVLKDKVNPKYRKAFSQALSAVDAAAKGAIPEAKQRLKIADNINFDHRIPKSIVEAGYADEINLIKLNPTLETFNVAIKNVEYDRPMLKLARKYELAPTKEKSKIMGEMQDLQSNFNKKYKNYLGDVTIKDVKGKPFFESPDQPITRKTDMPALLEKNIKEQLKIPQVAKTNKKIDQLNIKTPKKFEVAVQRLGCQGSKVRIKKVVGGSINTKTCYDKGLEKLRNKQITNSIDAKNMKEIAKVSTRIARTGGAAKVAAILGPAGIGLDLLFEGAVVGNEYLKGKPFEEAWGRSFLSYLGPNRQDPDKLEMDRSAGDDPKAQSYVQDVRLENEFYKNYNQYKAMEADNMAYTRDDVLAQMDRTQAIYNKMADKYEDTADPKTDTLAQISEQTGSDGNISILEKDTNYRAFEKGQERELGKEGERSVNTTLFGVPINQMTPMKSDALRRQKITDIFENQELVGQKMRPKVKAQGMLDYELLRSGAIPGVGYMAEGGLANLTETTPPKRSLNKDSQGLASLPEYDR